MVATVENKKGWLFIDERGVLTENEENGLVWDLAEFTDGQSGAKIAYLINEATLIAGINGSPSLNMTHFMLAMQRETKFLENLE